MRSICLLLSVAIPTALQGQSAGARAEAPFTTSGAFFALSVADLPASAAWYTEKLGLRPVMTVPKTGRVAAVVLEGGGLVVELVQHDDAMPRAAAPRAAGPELVHGIFKAGVLVADFDRVIATLRARGAEIAYGPYPAHGAQRANVIVRDNSGNLIQFLAK